MTGLETPAVDLPSLLRGARAQQRLSQLALSLELDISTRHLGFVEVGRSRPGRGLLLRWLERLEVPFGTRNQALRLAGYAPAYDESPLSGHGLAQARLALVQLIESHDPLPAVVIDSDWRIRTCNAGFRWLAAAAGATVEVPSTFGDDEVPGPTLIELALGPNGLGASLVNQLEVASAVLTHLRQDALTNPRLQVAVDQVAALLPSSEPPTAFPPTLVTRYATPLGELSFLSMFTTFGTPQSITLASLRIELLFPADDHTRAVMAGQQSPDAP